MSLLRPKALFVEVPSAIAVYFGYALIWSGTIPTIVPPNASGDMQPLATPFVIANHSPLLALQNVTTTCVFDRLIWSVNNDPALSGISTDHPQPHGEIGLGKSAKVDCIAIMQMRNWSKLQLNGDLVSMRAQIIVNYTTSYISRTYASEHFCWEPTPPSGHQWSVCEGLQERIVPREADIV
jgi:hypothetical protein